MRWPTSGLLVVMRQWARGDGVKVILENGFVTLRPENSEERAALLETFGRPEDEADDRGYREFHEKARGLHITLNADGVSVDIMAADAWWNYDD